MTLESAYDCDCAGCACGANGCEDAGGDAADPYGDGCDEYRDHPAWCGHYDDADFSSNEMCCACGGGAVDVYAPTLQPAPSPRPTAQPTGPTPAPTTCADDDGGGAAVDSYGDPCVEYMQVSDARCFYIAWPVDDAMITVGSRCKNV